MGTPGAEPAEDAAYLLDINVLLALFDPLHVHHAVVRGWYDRGGARVATCPLSELGFVRICSHPRYPNPVDSPEQGLSLLRALHAEPRHVFWQDAISLAADAFRRHPFRSHRETTDRYLLQLAAHRSARMLTLDAGIQPADKSEHAALFVLKQ